LCYDDRIFWLEAIMNRQRFYFGYYFFGFTDRSLFSLPKIR